MASVASARGALLPCCWQPKQETQRQMVRRHVAPAGGRGELASFLAPAPNLALEPTPNSVRSSVAVRRESGREEGGNTWDVPAPNEPWERSVVDHSPRCAAGS